MLPERIDVDRTLPDEGAIRHALEEFAVREVGPNAAVTRLHRVFYPVFRVTITYEDQRRLPWGASSERVPILLDGLWANNHGSLQQYRDGVTELEPVSTVGYDFGRGREGLGRTVLLDFQVTNDRAASLVPDRLADVRESDRFDESDSTTESFRNRLFETLDLPTDLDPAAVESVADVTRCYLPFWVAEVERPDERDLIGVVREQAEARDGSASHGWLASFVREDTSRLATYAHASIQQWVNVSESAVRADGTDRTTAGGSARPESATTESRSADSSSSPPSTAASSSGPIQPEGVDLEAGTLVDPSPDRSFADVGGMADLESRFRRSVIGPVERPAEYEAYGLDPVSGVLLYGPPGCGKTYIAGAVAGELEYAFLEASPADLASKYMGKPAENVQELFEIARANRPCVLFLDEIDALAGARENDSSTSERQMVNQLLTELENVGDELLVLAATNLIDDVDDAILRTGRFDERIEVPPPDAAARREILDIHLEGRPLATDLDLESLVDASAGYASSDLEYVAAEAARRALRAGDRISTSHLSDALADTDSSVPDWGGAAIGGGKTITQPDGVDLNARSLVTADVNRSFDDVGGMDGLKSRLRETVIEPLEHADRYAEYGLSTTNGVVLHGPPGCGKTYVAGALAGELEYAFLDVSPADLTSKWMGKPAQNVADLFEIARANAPIVCFLDEIDAIAAGRSGSGSGSGGTQNQSQRQMVNQLLAELESLPADVVVLAATNLLTDVDDAVVRSGRFDERLEVGPPDAAARREILAVHLADRPVADGIEWTTVVEHTAGYAASDLALLADNAARRAMSAGDRVRERHLLEAIAETASSIDGWGRGVDQVREESGRTRGRGRRQQSRAAWYD
ncbi:ATP-binding protein [Halobacteria archaeon AArc-m2/3/4]|uniref:ATP-binding protein n=1 Tax=Natronoglomus mannanivorans TaxID=2979990 RepID=A0ABT2Q968_9EURY|nr:ATP-binding protein [Halobacteria archaeon AArc-m2/3/4]